MKKKKYTIQSLLVVGLLGLALWGQQTFFSSTDETQSTIISSAESALAQLDYNGTQTIEVNNNQPTFSQTALSTSEGAWARYGDLDSLNRATSAEAMLHQSLMPTEKRGDISSVKPTGWRNKELANGNYLYNRTHLIGFALAGENANWKNLITGTSQLNNPEMLRFEMDINHYLKQNSNHYVRYAVTPIYRGEELVARGVHMEAQSIGEDTIRFNIYIFNIQEGVTINYQDGTSSLTSNDGSSLSKEESSSLSPTADSEAPTDQTTYIDQAGNGLIKGSKSGIYHIPGSAYYEDTTNPKEWFKTIAEAKAAGYRAPK